MYKYMLSLGKYRRTKKKSENIIERNEAEIEDIETKTETYKDEESELQQCQRRCRCRRWKNIEFNSEAKK